MTIKVNEDRLFVAKRSSSRLIDYKFVSFKALVYVLFRLMQLCYLSE